MTTLTHRELEHCFQLAAQYELSPMTLGYMSNTLYMHECIDYYTLIKERTTGHDPIWKLTESCYVNNYNAIVRLNAHLFKEVHTPKKDKAGMKVIKDPQARRIHELEQRLQDAKDAYRFMEAIVQHQDTQIECCQRHIKFLNSTCNNYREFVRQHSEDGYVCTAEWGIYDDLEPGVVTE